MSNRTFDGGLHGSPSGLYYGQGEDVERRRSRLLCVSLGILMITTTMLGTVTLLLTLMTAAGISTVTDHGQGSSASVPQYFQTSPQIFAGPTKTALNAPFLAQTNSVRLGTVSFAPTSPLETAIPVAGNTNHSNIFQLMGQLSPYFPNPTGFGVKEYSLPPGSNISIVNVLHRHGSRYPTSESSVSTLGRKIRNLTDSGTQWSGDLAFLHDWRYMLGAEILVASGRQELFDSGVQFYYNYGALYNTSTKIVARTTTQDRMLKSAEYFMAGFFGLEWTHNATLEPIIELPYYNNSLAGYMQCNNSNSFRSTAGRNASLLWQDIYLANATARLRGMAGGYNWTVADSYNAQTLCPYETVAYGYSTWCTLFTYQEWQGFEYSIDLAFQGNDGFLSPTGRGVGIGFVEELHARMQQHLYDLLPGATNANRTLDTMESTFPVNQSLYFDFSHDTNMFSVLTALGMTQFSDQLSNSTVTPRRNVTVSHITPFGARIVWEVIRSPHPVKATRPTQANATIDDYYETTGEATNYVHMMISQRTVPLHLSYPSCHERDDGWCEMNIFLEVLSTLLDTARYEYSCFGNYSTAPYLSVTNGRLPSSTTATDY